MVYAKTLHYIIVRKNKLYIMTDLKQMMDSVTLVDCQKEIEQQLGSIATHDNRMKRAVLLCFWGEAILNEIAKEDPDRFIDELKVYLSKITEENSEKGKRLMSHVKENGEIVKNIDTISDELREISSKVNSLMKDYDNRLTEIIKTRDNLPVCKL